MNRKISLLEGNKATICNNSNVNKMATNTILKLQQFMIIRMEIQADEVYIFLEGIKIDMVLLKLKSIR